MHTYGDEQGTDGSSDLVIVDPSGKKVNGARGVSSEIAMHLLIYRLRPDVGAVVHAHPPTATGYAAAGIALDSALCSEIIVTLGSVPLASYETPGTQELAEALSPLIAEHDAILMANHGVVTCGADLLTAYMNMETVEHFAKIALVTHQLGKQQPLSDQHVDKLREMRVKYRNHLAVAQGKTSRRFWLAANVRTVSVSPTPARWDSSRENTAAGTAVRLPELGSTPAPHSLCER